MNKTEERATKLIDTPKCLLVEVPERSKNFQIDQNWLVFDPWYPARGGAVVKDNMIKLPPGSYGQAILASEMDENRASGFVDWYEDSNDSSYDPQYNETTYFNVIKNYETDDEDGCDTFLESFASLLRSHNLKPSTTVVIPKTI